MNQDSLTREQVLRFLDGQISLDEFRSWLRPVTGKLREFPEPTPLTRRAALYIAEFNRGHRTEAELRQLLADETVTVYAEVAESLEDILTRAVAETTRDAIRAEVHIQPLQGFATSASQSRQTKHRTTTARPRLVGSR